MTIDICSNCKSHEWCTRHNENSYATLAEEVKRAIVEACRSSEHQNINVVVNKVGHLGGNRLGSFEVCCEGVILFSKL